MAIFADVYYWTDLDGLMADVQHLVVRFLSQAKPATLGEFQKIVDFTDMKDTG